MRGGWSVEKEEARDGRRKEGSWEFNEPEDERTDGQIAMLTDER